MGSTNSAAAINYEVTPLNRFITKQERKLRTFGSEERRCVCCRIKGM